MTFAEGLATRTAFELPLHMMRELVDDIVLVSEDELKHAIILLLEKAHTVAEGARGSVRRCGHQAQRPPTGPEGGLCSERWEFAAVDVAAHYRRNTALSGRGPATNEFAELTPRLLLESLSRDFIVEPEPSTNFDRLCQSPFGTSCRLVLQAPYYSRVARRRANDCLPWC